MKRIMLMADALFDARIGTVFQLNPKAGAELLANPDYRNREQDDIELHTNGVITKVAFDEAYANRSVETLKVSPYTNILTFVARMIALYKDNADTMREPEALVIIINTWPYEFNREELEMVTGLVNGALDDSVVVTADSVEPADLSPTFLNEGYGALILYNFEEWLAFHQVAFLERRERCFGMDVIAPRLFQVSTKDLTLKEKQRDIMRARTSLHEFFSVDFLEARWFSLYDPVAIAKVVIAMSKADEDEPPIMLRNVT